MKQKLINWLAAGALALLAWFATVKGFELFLVGKNKTAKSSSRHPGTASPISINDGITGSEGLVHTAVGDPLPWVMLDLQQPFAIFGARAWNREVHSQRFKNISFGVSSNPAVWTTFNKDLFDLCYYYDKVPTAADNPINITCPKPILGRYLAIYKNISLQDHEGDQTLSIYEIDIFALAKGALMYARDVQPSFPASSGFLLAQWTGLQGWHLNCLIRCSDLQSAACLSALVIPGSEDCFVFGSSSIPSGFVGSRKFVFISTLE